MYCTKVQKFLSSQQINVHMYTYNMYMYMCTTICDMARLSSQSLPGACVYYAWEEGSTCSKAHIWNIIKLKHRNGESETGSKNHNGN